MPTPKNEPTTPPETTPPPTPTGPATIGKTGYDRVLELLSEPPVDVSGLPTGGVPADLKAWLTSFKEPLAAMTVEAAVSALQSKISGYSRGRLEELYKQMTPAEVAFVMTSNANAIKKFADQKALEAAMIQGAMTKITEASAGYLLSALMLI